MKYNYIEYINGESCAINYNTRFKPGEYRLS